MERANAAGAALRDGYRAKVFLMTKFDSRTKSGTARQIEESLQRLQTDHIDLLQYHENIRMEDPDRFFAPEGPLETLLDAQRAGRIRDIGFTGHKDPAIHLRMLDLARQRNFQFATCQMPLNVMDPHFRCFERLVLPKLLEQGIAPLGMKPMGDANILKSGIVTAMECLHYALNLPAAVIITGCDSMDRVNQAVEAAESFKPMNPAQVSALLDRTKPAGSHGTFEVFKTTLAHDGTTMNPAWMA